MTGLRGDRVSYRIRDYPDASPQVTDRPGTFDLWRIFPKPTPEQHAAAQSLDFLFAADGGGGIDPQQWEKHPELLIRLYQAETCLVTGGNDIPFLPYIPLCGLGVDKALRFTWNPETLPPVPELSPIIDTRRRYYRQVIRDNPGLNFFDGPIIRVAEIESNAGEICFHLGPGSYFALMISTAEIDRPFDQPVTWRDRRAALARDLTRVPVATDTGACRLAEPAESGLTHPIGVAALVFTEDDYLVVGRRSERVSTFRGLLGPPVCGVVADVERFQRAASHELADLLTEEIRREAIEELRLPDTSAIAETQMLGAARELNRGGAFQFFFVMRLRISFQKLAQKIQADTNPEYAGFYGIRPGGGAAAQIAVCNDLIGRPDLDGRIIGNELRANLVYLRHNIMTPPQ